MEGTVWECLSRRVRGRGQGEGSWPQLQGNGPAVSLKNDNSPNRPDRSPGYANEVSAGWLAFNGAARDWRLAVGERLGVDDSWVPASQEQADREGGRKKSCRGRARRERERGRQADRLHNARLGPVLMCFLFWLVFLKFVNCGVYGGGDLRFGCGAAVCL